MKIYVIILRDCIFVVFGSSRFIFSSENKNHIHIDSILVFLSEKVKVTMFFSRYQVDVNINIICLFSKHFNIPGAN